MANHKLNRQEADDLLRAFEIFAQLQAEHDTLVQLHQVWSSNPGWSLVVLSPQWPRRHGLAFDGDTILACAEMALENSKNWSIEGP